MQSSGIAGVDWGAAALKLNEDGSWNLTTGATDLGTGADTVLVQIAAETLGVTPERIVISAADTDLTPYDVGAYASSITYVSGNAVLRAATAARDRVPRDRGAPAAVGQPPRCTAGRIASRAPPEPRSSSPRSRATPCTAR
jgi:CO/xanthine dehydrogenase Mo-binding subunit